MFELRVILESAVLESVVAKVSDKDLMQLSKMIDEESIAFTNGQRDTWIKLSSEFHIKLARLTGNQTLVNAITKYLTRPTLLISSSHPVTAGSCSFDEHLEILEVMKRRDTAAAIAVMRSHLEHFENRVPCSSRQSELRSALGRER
jgi:DNA-binding GntR family transcriptional regulator